MGGAVRRFAGWAVAGLALAFAGGAQAQALLHAMFQDHAVLQRDRSVPVWGRAAPGESVTVSLGERRATATADGQGRWRAVLPPMAAGGPYVLSARTSSGASQSVSDVMVGDVWLCSGQSNMQFETRYSTDAYSEVSNARHPNIRLFQVDQSVSAAPLETFEAGKRQPSWAPVTPESVASFSAACYFFARELQKTVKVPQGLIHASWGGSTIQAWLGEGSLRKLGYGASVDALRRHGTDPAGAQRAWGRAFQQWWLKENPGKPQPWSPGSAGFKPAPVNLGAWENWNAPELAGHDGLVWLRTSVDLTPAQARQAGVLNLGAVNDADITWVNGEVVGSQRSWSGERSYPVRKGLLKAGRNSVLVAVFNMWSLGGFTTPEKLALQVGGDRLPLTQGWSYLPGPSGNGASPFPPWDALFGTGGLRNGMFAPLGPYAYRGALWYQGESNTARPREYGPMLQALISDLRADQGHPVEFYAVQLAAFGARAAAPVDSGWARLREEQRRVIAADPRAGLAVAIDIGDPTDVHPPQKVELGRRLARAARHVGYGDPAPASGPVPSMARRQDGQVAVVFRDVTGQLVTFSSDRAIGFELCQADGRGCAFADARVSGADTVLLTAPAGAPTPGLVRFCWADSPICNLYDGSGLPAGPFEIALP
jgi:sialate O-acetylesterase